MTRAELLARYAAGERNFNGASLNGASLRGANLRGANLDGANFDGANFDGASLRGASLNGASLRGANLRGANFDGASLDGAYFTPGLILAGRAHRGDYEFFAWWTLFGPVIRAGCRTWLSMSDAREHYHNHPRAAESLLILDYLEGCLARVTARVISEGV